MGTGSAEVPSDQLSELAQRDAEPLGVSMQWTRNRFVGEHWIFGKVSIELDDQQESTGTISNFHQESGRTIAYNTNRFYFKFRSSRFPKISLRTADPIVNAAHIDAIPPVGARFNLIESKSINLTRHYNDKFSTNFRRLTFDFCEVTAFPERNISVVSEKIEYAGLVATISVRITNLTEEKVRATYFVVDHSNELTPQGDAVFFDLGARASELTTFTVTTTVNGYGETLSLFAGIYKPERLQGSAEAKLSLQF